MTDLERHIPMAERLCNAPGDAGRMARSFLAAMRENADLRARLAEVEAERDRWERDAHNLAWSRDQECQAKHAAQAALARVEALCDREERHVAHHVPRPDALVSTEQVRAAAEGDRAAVLRTRQISREELRGILGLPEGEGDRG